MRREFIFALPSARGKIRRAAAIYRAKAHVAVKVILEVLLRRSSLLRLRRRCESGPVVGLRHHTFDWDGRRLSQREEYRIVPVRRFDSLMQDANEAWFVTELRWWKARILARGAERLTSLAIADIVQGYLENGAPDPLPEEEYLVD